MNLLNRAFLGVIRNRKRSILFFLLVAAIGVFMAMLLLINQASIKANQSIVGNLRPQGIIGLDYAKMQHTFETNISPIVPPLDIELVSQIVSMPYVSDYNIFLSRELFSSDVVTYRPLLGGYSASGRSSGLGYIYRVVGVQNPHFAEIRHKIIDVTYGSLFAEEEISGSLPVALVSEELAKKNQLHIGSVITLRSVVFNPNEMYCFACLREDKILGYLSFDVEIVGIFDIIVELTSEHASNWANNYIAEDMHNRIYVPGGFVELIDHETSTLAENLGFYEKMNQLQELDPSLLSRCETRGIHHQILLSSRNHFTVVDNLIALHNPHYIVPFQKSVEALLPEYYTIEFAENNFQAIMNAFESLENMSRSMLIGTVMAMILILGLLIILFMRDRKREIGIYLALGESKKNISGQIILEVILISLPAFICALLIGRFFGNGVSEHMLINDLLVLEEMKQQGIDFSLFFRFGLGYDQIATNTMLENYNIALSIEQLLLFLGIGLGSTIVATIIPLLYAMRFQPKKILM